MLVPYYAPFGVLCAMPDLRSSNAEASVAQPLADTPAAEPKRRYRLLVDLAIGVFLALQVATPLHYYVSDQRDDERFSWRMFSSVRVRDCRVTVTEFTNDEPQTYGREVAVERDVQITWLRLLERRRAAVIDAYLQRRCAQPDVVRARFTTLCRASDAATLPLFTRELSCSAAKATP